MTTAETATDKLDFKRILPIIAIVLVDLMGLSIIIPLMPLFAARFGANPLIIGILQAAYPSMQFIGTPILGRLSDRFGRKPILLFSQLGTFAGFILLGFANALWILFLSRIIDGLSGANLSTAQAAVADSTDEKNRTQGLGLIGAAFGVGFILGPIIAYLVLAASGGDYRAVALTAACFSLMSILMTTFLFHETHHDDSPSATKLKSPFTFSAMLQALTLSNGGLFVVGDVLLSTCVRRLRTTLFVVHIESSRHGCDRHSGFVRAGRSLYRDRSRRIDRSLVKTKRRPLACDSRSVHISHRLDRHIADAERAGAVVQPSQRAEKFGGTKRDADHNAKHQSEFAE